MQEVPVYIFTGFMDSGKTTMMKDTLINSGFAEDLDSILILQCEDGDEEFTQEELDSIHAKLFQFEDEDDFFDKEKLLEIDKENLPDAIFIEYNGTWGTDRLYAGSELPDHWVVAQSLAVVDATTFEMYLLNMRQMMQEQLKQAEVIFFNRYDKSMNKSKIRTSVKAFNRPAQIVYMLSDGSIDQSPEELPFDITKDELEISDSDYAIWFTDCMDNPKKYDGKIVSFTALIYNPSEGDGKLKPGVIVPGRFAMTCCVEDIQFLGMKCKYADASSVSHKSWVKIKAKVKHEFAREYKGKGPVLYPISLEATDKPEDELVYFN